MTTIQANQIIGSRGLLRVGAGFDVEVLVVDAREVWGRSDVLVAPTSGLGQMWVEMRRVKMLEEEPC